MMILADNLPYERLAYKQASPVISECQRVIEGMME